MANQQRGEVTLELVGKKYTLRPTFEALCELEDRLNLGILEIFNILHGGDIRLRFISAVVWSGIWGYDKDKAPSYEEVGDMVMKTGIANVIHQGVEEHGSGSIGVYLLNGVAGEEEVTSNLAPKDGDQEGNVKVGAGKKKEGSAST